MSVNTTARPLPTRRVAPSALALLQAARRGLAESAEATVPAGRYVAAHLSALRAAAALLATREPVGAGRRGRPRSVWVLLPEADPALSEWAAFFAAGAGKRAAAEAGLPRAVTGREAEELLRDAEIFVALVEDTLGLPGQPTIPIADSRAG
jgi:SAV_6107-like HEPN